jgi:hypothetical protein
MKLLVFGFVFDFSLILNKLLRVTEEGYLKKMS